MSNEGVWHPNEGTGLLDEATAVGALSNAVLEGRKGERHFSIRQK